MNFSTAHERQKSVAISPSRSERSSCARSRVQELQLERKRCTFVREEKLHKIAQKSESWERTDTQTRECEYVCTFD
eukprot:2692548-Pleurochrysis_carterae.AAC.2